MAYISSITLPNGSQYDIKPSTTTLSSVNLNTITGTGFYTVNNCTNSKYTQATLMVVNYSSTYCSQTEIDLSTGKSAVRILNNGTWGAWKEIGQLHITYTDNTAGGVTATIGVDS